MFAGAPNFTFVIFNNSFKKRNTKLSDLLEKFEIFNLAGFVGIEKHVFLEGDKIHNSDGQILAGRKIESTALFSGFNFVHKGLEIKSFGHGYILSSDK